MDLQSWQPLFLNITASCNGHNKFFLFRCELLPLSSHYIIEPKILQVYWVIATLYHRKGTR